VTPWTSSSELRGDLQGFLGRYLRSADGDEAAALATEFNGNPVLEITFHDPDLVVHVDIAARSLVDGPAADPAVRLSIRAADLHDLLLERLGPVEISRLVEEKHLHLVGPPRALAASVVLAARLQPHYAPSLVERGRADLLDTPMPATGEIWESELAPTPIYGVRRPWQRPKGAAAIPW
jgi:hypothetical protein